MNLRPDQGLEHEEKFLGKHRQHSFIRGRKAASRAFQDCVVGAANWFRRI
jgi:hypothetical protein